MKEANKLKFSNKLKRYWKLCTLTLVILLAIGVFYLKPILSKSEYPDFTIETIKGNPIELNGLTLQGYYSLDAQYQEEFGMMYSEKTFSLNNKNLIYDKQKSFSNQLSYIDRTPQLDRLQKEHKNFLRGKNLQTQNFFEDASFLVYISLNQEYSDKSSGKRFFDISMLNKKTDKRLSYKIDLPTKKEYPFIDIQKIQIINSHLSVVTRNNLPQINEQEYSENLQEYHIYQLDLGNQKVTTDNSISFETDTSADNLTQIELLSETAIDQTSDDLIFSLSYDQPFNGEKETESSSGVVGYDLFHYKISKNETKKITLPKEFNTSDSINSLDKKMVYSYHFTDDNKISLYTTSLVDLSKSSEKTIDLSVSQDSIEWQSIKNNKLYLVSSMKQSLLKKHLFIYNLSDEKLIYEGSIEPTSDNALTKRSGLRIDYGLIE